MEFAPTPLSDAPSDTTALAAAAHNSAMQPPHPQDGALGHTAGAAGAEEPAEGAGGGGEGGSSETFIVPEVAAVLSQANDFWAQNLMPRARAIESVSHASVAAVHALARVSLPRRLRTAATRARSTEHSRPMDEFCLHALAPLDLRLLRCLRRTPQEVVALTYEANAVTGRAEAEKQDLVKELGRLSELVLSFQSRIQQVRKLARDAGGGCGVGRERRACTGSRAQGTVWSSGVCKCKAGPAVVESTSGGKRETGMAIRTPAHGACGAAGEKAWRSRLSLTLLPHTSLTWPETRLSRTGLDVMAPWPCSPWTAVPALRLLWRPGMKSFECCRVQTEWACAARATKECTTSIALMSVLRLAIVRAAASA